MPLTRESKSRRLWDVPSPQYLELRARLVYYICLCVCDFAFKYMYEGYLYAMLCRLCHQLLIIFYYIQINLNTICICNIYYYWFSIYMQIYALNRCLYITGETCKGARSRFFYFFSFHWADENGRVVFGFDHKYDPHCACKWLLSLLYAIMHTFVFIFKVCIWECTGKNNIYST